MLIPRPVILSGLLAGGSLLLFLAPAPFRADVITLKDGKELEGLIVEVSEVTIRIRKGTGHLLISRDLSRSEVAAVRLSPPDVSDLRELARQQESERDLEEAAQTLRQISALWPESAADQLKLAQILRKLGRFPEAALAAGAAAKADPHDSRIPLEQGEISLASGDPEASVAFAREHLRRSGFDGAEGNWLLGRGCEKGDRAEDAFLAYQRVLEANPRQTEVLERLIDLGLRTGKAEEAAQVAEKVMRAAPGLRAGWMALGKVQYRQGRFQAAAETFQSATSLGGPEYSRARIFLQCARARKSGLDPLTLLAPEDLDTAEKLDPELRREKP